MLEEFIYMQFSFLSHSENMLGYLHDTASKGIVDKIDSFYKNT